MSRGSRIIVGGVALGAAMLLAPPGASAHVGVDQDEIVAGQTTTLAFGIGHGCEGSPTTSMRFQVPESIVNAQPFVKPGWTIETERAALETPLESAHGDPQTDRVAVIAFSAADGSAVPNDLRDTFSIRFTAPEEPGTLYFKVVQGCEAGENAWIEEWDGTGEEPDSPAPTVRVVAAGDAGDAEAGEGADPAVTTVPVDASTGSDDSSSNGLAIAALVVGALGLGAGGTALVRGRKPAAS